MARIARVAALSVFTLIGAPFQCSFAGDAGVPVAVGARLSQDASAAKLVFDLSQPVDVTAYALASPDRIVVNMPEVNFQLDPSVGRTSAMASGSLVKGFRFGLLAPGKSRVVIDLERGACPVQLSAKPIVKGESAARLTIELKACDPSAFDALVRSSAVSPQTRLRRAPPRVPSSSSIQVTAESTVVRADFAERKRRPLSSTSAPN